jgi:hypothetical protein
VSTVKTDVITAVSTNGDLSLDGLGSGGVSIASTLKMTKGGDIASASPLVIDTDGNYFDVTGTTNFAAMTVEAGNFFMLQFDGALTITHGSGIELPGASNLTTATGDRLICYATAADTVEVMSVATEAAAAAGGAWTLIGTSVASTSASLTVTGLDSTYDNYAIGISDIILASDTQNLILRVGDSGGIDSGGSDYSYHALSYECDTTTLANNVSVGASSIVVERGGTGNDTGEGVGAMLYLHSPSDATMRPQISGTGGKVEGDGIAVGFFCYGARNSVIALTQIQILATSGNLTSGRLSVWGISHA